jgi:hypothetical protein
VRGVADDGSDLVISRDYISHGLRSWAEDLVSAEGLAPRPSSDSEYAARTLSAGGARVRPFRNDRRWTWLPVCPVRRRSTGTAVKHVFVVMRPGSDVEVEALGASLTLERLLLP